MKPIGFVLLVSVLLGLFIVPICVATGEFLGNSLAGWIFGSVLSLGAGCYALWDETRPRTVRDLRESHRPEGMMDDLLDSLSQPRSKP